MSFKELPRIALRYRFRKTSVFVSFQKSREIGAECAGSIGLFPGMESRTAERSEGLAEHIVLPMGEFGPG